MTATPPDRCDCCGHEHDDLVLLSDVEWSPGLRERLGLDDAPVTARPAGNRAQRRAAARRRPRG